MILGKLVKSIKQYPQCYFTEWAEKENYQKTIQLFEVEHRPTYLKLKRERYLFKNCGSNFSATTSLVDDYCQFSK